LFIILLLFITVVVVDCPVLCEIVTIHCSVSNLPW